MRRCADLHHEPADGVGIAEHLVVDLKVGGDFLGFDLRMLVVRAILLLALGAAVPFLMKAAYTLAGESKSELLASGTPEQDVLDDGLHDLRRVGGHGYGDAEVAANSLSLPNENVEHGLIDFVVAPPDRYATNLRLRLAESIDASLALFKSIWIPRQIVVDNSVELLLEVYSLAQAIGRDEHVMLMRLQIVDAFAPDLVRIIAGNRRDFEVSKLVSEPALQFQSNVFGGRNEVAENDRLIAVAKQSADGLNRLVQFVVRLCVDDCAGFACELRERAALFVGPFSASVVEGCSGWLVGDVVGK